MSYLNPNLSKGMGRRMPMFLAVIAIALFGFLTAPIMFTVDAEAMWMADTAMKTAHPTGPSSANTTEPTIYQYQAGDQIKEFRLWPDSEIRPNEVPILNEHLSNLALASDSSPSTSYVSVVRFLDGTANSRVHVRLSDGMIYYAAGAGENLREALANLRVNPDALRASS